MGKNLINNEKGIAQIYLIIIGVVTVGILLLVFYLLSPFRSNSTNTSAKQSAQPSATSSPSSSTNNAPFMFTLIGVPQGKSVNTKVSNTLYVPLTGNCTINLSVGSFNISDNNCIDGQAAFALPSVQTKSGNSGYMVYVKTLGKPKGSSATLLCTSDVTSSNNQCATQSMVLFKNSGRTRLSNVTNTLLTVYVDTNSDGVFESYNIFDSAMQNYFWSYDNNGMKVAQLWFYPATIP